MRYDPKSGETTEYFTGVSHTNGLCFDDQATSTGASRAGDALSGSRRMARP